MANERKDQDQTKDLDAEVTELEDKDLEEASGGTVNPAATGDNLNCNC